MTILTPVIVEIGYKQEKSASNFCPPVVTISNLSLKRVKLGSRVCPKMSKKSKLSVRTPCSFMLIWCFTM